MNKPLTPPEPLWNAMDVAAFLGVSRSWVYLHGDRGDLPERRIGGLRRYVPSAIRAFALGETDPRKV